MSEKETGLVSVERQRMFTAALWLRLGAVVAIAATVEPRQALPLWMRDWILYVSLPLLLYNLAALKWRNALEHLLTRYPLLLVDLMVAMALLSIGGGWRSSYFVYTLTTLLLFTVFLKRYGVWGAAAVFGVFALLNDPTHSLSPIAVFGQTDWDMRVGSALFYVTASLILGYFDWLLTRIEGLAKEKIAETNRWAAIQERNQLALRLPDGAKQMILALRLRSGSLLRDQQWDETALRRELEWLWRGMSYLRTELTQLVEALQGQKQAASYEPAMNQL